MIFLPPRGVDPLTLGVIFSELRRKSKKCIGDVTCLPHQFSFSSLSMSPSINGVGAEGQQHGEEEWRNTDRKLNDGDGILEVNNEEKV